MSAKSVNDKLLSLSTWDGYFMDMATLVASKSKDRSIRCGTVIVGEGHTILSTGYNGFPRGVDDYNEDYHKRPEKYLWTSHDAQNAVFNAARNGIKLLHSRSYHNAHPCHDCARALVQAGIVEVTIPTNHDDLFDKKELRVDWKESCSKAREIFKAANVMVTEYGV